MRFNIHIDDHQVLAGLRESKRAMNQEVKRSLARGAQTHVLPVARSVSPRFLRDAVAIKATPTQVYLTVSGAKTGRLVRAGAVLEYGGTIKTPIRPRHGKALKIGDRYVSLVSRPRVIAGKHFLQGAADRGRPALARALEVDVERAIQHHIDGLA